jgi:hypothetical protein
MDIRRLCIAVAISAATGAFTSGAVASPLSGAGSELKTAITAPAVEKAAYRRCWWRHGYRVCRWVGGYYDDGYYDDGYYGYGPYIGFGPGIGFGFGGGHFHGGHFHGGHGHR